MRGTLPLAQDADLIIHEATFAHDLADMAYQYHHSTARQAAELAREAGGRELLLTHFSSRYSSQEELIPLLEEAQAIFPNTLLAEEFCTFPVHRRAAGNAPGNELFSGKAQEMTGLCHKKACRYCGSLSFDEVC